MPKINDLELPEEMVGVLNTLLDGASNDVLVGLGRNFPGGFRDPKKIRERVRSIITGPGPLPKWVQDDIRQSLPASAPLSAMSLDLLRANLDDLLAATGPAELVLACLLDTRPEIRQLGKDRLGLVSTTVSEERKAQAQARWLEVVNSCFTGVIGLQITAADEADEDVPVPPDYVQRMEKEVAELKQQVMEVKGKLEKERAARLEERRRLAAEAAARLDQQVVALKKQEEQVRQLAEREKILAADLEKQRLETGKTIGERVQSELAALERRWLSSAMELDSVTADQSAVDLLSAVDSALEKQKIVDRHSGNRIELQKRLLLLRTAARQVEDTCQNAIHPVPELAGLGRQLVAEINRLEARLGVGPAADGFLERMLQQINQCPDHQTLHDCSDLADRLVERGLVVESQIARIMAAQQRRHDILAAQNKNQESPTHWLSLGTILHRNLDCRLLLDGHNLLFNHDHLRSYLDNGKPGAKARSRLIELIRSLSNGRTKLHVRIVFDGPEESLVNAGPNLQVMFSGGGSADQRADDKIVHVLKQESHQNLLHHTFVITDDRTLQARIRQFHANYMPIAAFDLLLRNLKCI